MYQDIPLERCLVYLATLGFEFVYDDAFQILDNSWYVIAIELMAGAQAVEFRKPLKAGKGTQVAYDFVRKHVKMMVEDRPVQHDINNLAAAVKSGELLDAVEHAVGKLS